MSGSRAPNGHGAVPVTVAYITHRAEPRFDWFIDGLAAQLDDDPVEVLVVDGLRSPEREAQVVELVAGRFACRHVAPKPNPWNGPHRLTGADRWAAASARNTAIVHARGDYLVCVDDCSVLGPRWWEQVRTAARERWVIAGAYQKHRQMHVVDGMLVESHVEASGIDSRWELAADDQTVTIAGGQMYGNFGAPRDLLIHVNGFDELCDPIGGEDYHLGIRLEWSGERIRYSRRMLTIESDHGHDDHPPPRWTPPPLEPHAYMEMLARFGVRERTTDGPCDASHLVLDVLYGTREVRSIGNYYDLRELDGSTLHELPARFPERYWFADVAMAEL